MKNNLASTSKADDIAIGFFGWVILINLYFAFLFFVGGWDLIEGADRVEGAGRITLFLGLPTIVAPIIFL